MKKVCRLLRSRNRFEKLHFTCEWAPLLLSLMFVHCTQLWKWKNNRGGRQQNSSRKNNENNKFSVTTVANWMVYFYYMESQCYKLKLFIFNASRRNTFSPSEHATLPEFSILYGLRRKKYSLLSCWCFTSHILKRDTHRRERVTLQICL
jgi:hypothetical protein